MVRQEVAYIYMIRLDGEVVVRLAALNGKESLEVELLNGSNFLVNNILFYKYLIILSKFIRFPTKFE